VVRRKLVEWRQEFCTGIGSVDREHRELLELINSLHASLESCADLQRVINVLDEVYQQLHSHFETEEALMKSARYVAYNEHRLDHETLLEDLREIISSIDEDWCTTTDELAVDLDRWCSDHFRTHDAKLHTLIK